LRKAVPSKRLKRVINCYVLAQDDPYNKRKIKLLQRYLYQKNIGNVSRRVLKKHISRQLKARKEKKRVFRMETALFNKEREPKMIKYGSAFCPNCDMYKNYLKECPYCNKLELTR